MPLYLLLAAKLAGLQNRQIEKYQLKELVPDRRMIAIPSAVPHSGAEQQTLRSDSRRTKSRSRTQRLGRLSPHEPRTWQQRDHPSDSLNPAVRTSVLPF